MPKYLRSLVTFLILCHAAGLVLAQSPSIPSAAHLTPHLSGSVTSADISSGATYFYTLSNDRSSHEAAMLLAINFGLSQAGVLQSPFGWGASDQVGAAHLLGWSAHVGSEIQPGAITTGFVIQGSGLPGITDAYVVGDVPIAQLPVYPKYSAPDTIPGSSVTENSVHLQTVGPVPVPSNFQPTQFLLTIIGYKEQAIQQGWIRDRGIGMSLDAKLNAAKAALSRGENREAANILRSLLREIDERGEKERDDKERDRKELSPEAVALLKFNTQYLIGKIH